MRPTTFECLLAHFAGNPMLPIETVAKYLEIDKETLVSKINKREISLTYFRAVESQKGRKFVMVSDLADHLDGCHKKAAKEMANANKQACD
jgi:hypothetical protein